MSTTKTYTPREVRRILQENGYYVVPGRGKGGHAVYSNGHNKIMIPKSFNKMLVQRELRSNCLI